MKKLLNVANYLVLLIFTFIVTFLFNISLFSTSYISNDYHEVTFFIGDNIIRNILIILLICIFIVFSNKINILNRFKSNINSNTKLYKTIKNLLLISVLIISILWVLSTKFVPSSDQLSVQIVANDIIHSDFTAFLKGEYLERWPNQTGLVFISYFIQLMFGDNYVAFQLLNCLCLVVIFNEIVKFGRALGLDNFDSLLLLIANILFIPMTIYTYFVYGTIPGLAFALVAINKEIDYFKNENIKDLLISAISISFSVMFKSNYLIFFIAMLLLAITKTMERFSLKRIAFIFAIIVAFAMQQFVPKAFLENKANIKLDGGVSTYGHIAMGLQEGDRAPGWFNGYNQDTYFAVNFDSDAQKELAKKYIDNRVEYFKENKDYAKEFFVLKTASQWNNPSFQCFWNLQDKLPENKQNNQLINHLLGINGSNNIIKVLNIYQSIILFGVVLYFVSHKPGDFNSLIYSIVVVGGFTFHMFWEAKAQYTFTYFILLFPYAVKGYSSLKNLLNKKSIILVLLISIVFAFVNPFNEDYLMKDSDSYYYYVETNGLYDNREFYE